MLTKDKEDVGQKCYTRLHLVKDYYYHPLCKCCLPVSMLENTDSWHLPAEQICQFPNPSKPHWIVHFLQLKLTKLIYLIKKIFITGSILDLISSVISVGGTGLLIYTSITENRKKILSTLVDYIWHLPQYSTPIQQKGK